MCGRYTLKFPPAAVEERFDATSVLTEVPPPNYNASPATLLPIITNTSTRNLQNGRWGLVPLWAQKEPKPSYFINATLEGILTTKSFKDPIDHQRCLVVADGYYEWKTVGKIKIPYYVQIDGGKLFAFAAIYETLGPHHTPTFSLITQEASEKLAFIHHRMPAILLPEQEKAWLDKGMKGKEAKEMIVRYPDDLLHFFAVSDKVNKADGNDPSFILPKEYKAVPTQGSLF